jgi:hypothetical protein
MGTISRRDVNELAAKLEKFAQDLPRQEAEVLGWILARAQATAKQKLSKSALDRVSTPVPLSKQLAEAVGLGQGGPSEDVNVNVTWTKSIG